MESPETNPTFEPIITINDLRRYGIPEYVLELMVLDAHYQTPEFVVRDSLDEESSPETIVTKFCQRYERYISYPNQDTAESFLLRAMGYN